MVRALNAKIEATQKAQQRENEVQQAMAEAEISRQEAQGVADAQLIKAKAEAEAINVKGRALRDNPAILELNAVEKWDGKLPVYAEPSAVPFLNLK
jgi:regulator of protease activity HflC (stomatin/prohibitin superfamily)